MSSSQKEELRATIVDLVAMEDVDKEGFFRTSPVDEQKSDVTTQGAGIVTIADRLRAANMLVPDSVLNNNFSDEYRRIKRPLISNAFGKTAQLVNQGNLIMVTSSVPGEGKTHTAINLALSIAQERDHTVLLVDSDVSKQGTSRMLGIVGKAGLVDLLENDKLTIADVLLNTDIPELRVLCAGKQHEYVTELLASQRMESLINEMVTRYDDRVIIIDGPPLLPTPQTQILASLVGQVVFVIEAGKTPQAIVEEALNLIPDDKATGLVLNKGEGIVGHSGYYYDYYSSDSPEK
jgi:protein-tyrosine kinase